MSSNSRERLDRARFINQVIDDYLDRPRRAGADHAVSPEALVALHANLMPELGEQLFKLQVIESAARSAGVGPNAVWDIDPGAPGDAAENFGREFGDYELLEEIGRGGMGVLYRAWQKSLERIVAIKVILAGQMAAQEDVQRFHAEATMAASLDHPGIVPVYEVGVHQGQHYYAMALVDGPNLGALVQDRPLAEAKAAQYLQQIAEAVSYAHRQGVVHRDLKPSNVLVDAGDLMRITDFGLAKWIDTGSQLTATGRILGTPDYMSPEQAAGDQDRIGPASDVYSLGAIFYELLVGRPPFKADSTLATLKQVTDCEPVSPRLFNASISRDLETICLKCLEKDPDRRYASAQELAADLNRFLEGRPITARPIGKAARAARWCKRNPSIATLSASVALALLAGTGVSAYFAVKAQSRAEESHLAWKTADAQRQRVLAHVEINSGLLSDAQAWHGIRMLKDEDNHCGLLHLLAARQSAAKLPQTRDLRDSLWAAYYRQIGDSLVHVVGHSGPVVDVAISPDGKMIATASEDGAARLWEMTTGRPRCDNLKHAGKVNMVAFSPDGTLLATASEDNTARLWLTATSRPHGNAMQHDGSVRAVAFSPDGKFVATGAVDSTLHIWDAATTAAVGPSLPHDGAVTAVRFSPSGKLLASLTQVGTLQFFNAGDWTPAFPPREYAPDPLGRRTTPYSLVFSPVESILATVSGPSKDKRPRKSGVQLIDTTTGMPSGPQIDHDSGVRALALSPDGKTLATACTNGQILLCSTLTGAASATIDAHAGRAWTLAFSPDGKTLATGSWDGTVKLWTIGSKNNDWKLTRTFRHLGRVWKVSFSPDGQRLVSASDDGSARVWNAQEPPQSFCRLSHHGLVNSVDISGDSRLVVTASDDHTAQLWDPHTGQPNGEPLRHDAPALSALFSPDGKLVATLCKNAPSDGRVQFWSTDTRQRQGDELRHADVELATFSPDGKQLATASLDGTIRFWDVATGQLQAEPRQHNQPVACLAFSDDGKLLASASDDHTVRVWDCRASRAWKDPLKHDNNVRAVAFSPSGRVLASGGWDSTVRLWSLATTAPLCPPLQHFRGVTEIVFSPDGKLFASASEDRYVRFWDSVTWKLHGEPLPHDQPVFHVAFSPNSQYVAAGCGDGLVALWQMSTGMPLARFKHPNARIRRVAFSADGRLLASVAYDCSALVYRLWTVPTSLREIELRTWLAVGARISDQGATEPISSSEWQNLRDELDGMTPTTITMTPAALPPLHSP